MRTAFIEQLLLLARQDPDIFLVVGDLGYSVVEPFANEFPSNYLNAGVAEQNMTGLAAGLAREGFKVFTYSIANFPTLRCLEQIRNDVCYHNVPVTVVSVGAGMAYGMLGFSHHALQDIAVLRALPNLRVLSPADPGECRECLDLIVSDPRPTYLRLGKAGETELHQIRGITQGPLCIRKGTSPIAFAATGSILKVALQAADILAGEGQEVSVYSCPVLTGVPDSFFNPLWAHPTVISVEEHCRPGGFGSLLREVMPDGARVIIKAVENLDFSEVGSQEYLRERAGLSAESLAALARVQFSPGTYSPAKGTET